MRLTVEQEKIVQKSLDNPHVQAKAMACLQIIMGEDTKASNADVMAVASILFAAGKEVMMKGETKDAVQISKD